MRVDHIGYAVKSIDRARKSMAALGWSFGDTVDDNDRNVAICFGSLGASTVELVAPLDRTTSSPVDEVLSKNGPTPYHICYVSDDVDADVDSLVKQRFKITRPLAPAIAFGGRRVVFLYSLAAGLVEIVEATEQDALA